MSVTQNLAQRLTGRTAPPGEPYLVTRPAVRAFASAVQAGLPVHHDVAAAQSAGYADLLAPPTFVVVITQAADFRLLADPEVGIRLRDVVHAEQAFHHDRSVVVGDQLIAQTEVERARAAGSVVMVSLRTSVSDAAGEPVAAAKSTLVIRPRQTQESA